MLSSDDANATRPKRLMRPYVGFTPTMPQNAAGWRTEPPVSEPNAIGTMPAATAAAEPPDEPPGTRVRSMGLRAGPYAENSVDEPIANSSMFPLPTRIAPASRSFRATVDSYGLTYPSRIFEPHEVLSMVVAMLSFSTTGTPASAPPTGALSTATQRRVQVGREDAVEPATGPRRPRAARAKLASTIVRGAHLPLAHGGGDRARAGLRAAIRASPSRLVSRVFVRREARHEEESVDHRRHRRAVERAASPARTRRSAARGGRAGP